MIKRTFLFLFLFIFFLSHSQEINVNQVNSHELYVKTLKNSKDLMYQDILNAYDSYIEKNPNTILIQVYRCKFIGTAYYDEYEGYDLNYEETEKCLNELYSSFPEHPEVILYKLESLYGEEKLILLNETIKLYERGDLDWSYLQISKLFEIAAVQYESDNDSKSVRYAEKAEKFSDSLDLSVTIAKGYLNLDKTEEARERLLFSLYRDNNAWNLTQKGELLVQLGENEEALKNV